MSKNKDSKSENIKSADDLIIADENAKLGKPIPEKAKLGKPIPEKAKLGKPIPEKTQSAPKSEEESSKAEEEATPIEEQQEVLEEKEKPTEEKDLSKDQEPENESTEDKASSDTSENEEVDEYGTKIGKKKLYTDEEVQRMIRERLARGKHADQEQQQNIQQAAKDFKPDPESEESWESQLETFVEKTIEKLSKKQTDAEWRKREEQNQAEFEVKFTEGMGKYKDFQGVVGGKPITNAMMLATRSMKDPAAFLYAACKSQSKELARIAQIQDAVTQAAEIGRLEERMKKARSLPSSPKPAKLITGDASDELPQLDIDARIAQHAKTKIMR